MPEQLYGLVSSRDFVVRYVGKTKRKVNERFKEHVKSALKGKDNSYKAKWIRSEVNDGYAILPIVLFESCEGINEASLLTTYSSSGHSLTNTSDYKPKKQIRLRGNPDIDVEGIVSMYNGPNGTYSSVARHFHLTIDRVRRIIIKAICAE